MKRTVINLKLTWFFIKRHLRLFLLVLTLTLMVACFESITLAALYDAINALFQIQSGNTEAGKIFQVLSSGKKLISIHDPLISSCVFLIIVLFIRFTLSIAREALAAYTSGDVMYQTKKDLFLKYASLNQDFFINERQGNILYMVTNAPNRVTHALLGMTAVMSDGLRILAIGAVLSLLNFELTGLLLIFTGLYYLLTNKVARSRSYVTGLERLRAYTALTTIMSEFCNGFKNITAYCVKPFWQNRFDRENRIYSYYYVTNLVWLAIPRNVMLFIGTSSLFMIALYFKLFHSEFLLTSVSTVSVFTMATLQILPSISSLGQKFMEVVEMQPDVELIHDLLTRQAIKEQERSSDIKKFSECLEFKNVFFAHQGREVILKNVNLHIQRGDVVAIVGASGAGKTTILNLVMGFYKPNKGDIFIDGKSIQNICLTSWLHRIGFVSQDPFIYHSSVYDNIVLGRPHVYDDVERVAKIANAHDFIMRLPKGYDTIVGEKGMKLSGGQQQRIAITRALLADPDILIFDEATSALDEESEKLIRIAMDRIAGKKTLLIVAHRISTIEHANRIYVLTNGSLEEYKSAKEYMESSAVSLLS